MPVWKARQISDLPEPRATPLDPGNLRSAFDISEAALKMRARAPRRGVRRYRSIEEANEDARADPHE